MIKIEEFSYEDSRKYLYLFQREEEQLLAKQGQMLGADWYECDDENATYIWLLKDMDAPLGFLSYKQIFLDDTKDFIYIVKVYALENYRGKNPILIEERRVICQHFMRHRIRIVKHSFHLVTTAFQSQQGTYSCC